MDNVLIIITLACLTVSGCKQNHMSNDKTIISQAEGVRSAFHIEILDEEALDVIDPKTEIQVMAEGFNWVEGPLWINEEDGYFLFSDIPENTVYKLDDKGVVTTYLKPSGYTGAHHEGAEPGSNGLLLNGQGQLVLMQHGDRRVAKMNAPLAEPDEKYITLTDNYKGLKFNSPNDGIYDDEGNLYFTDPPYGLPKQMEDPSKELRFQGVYCLLNDGSLLLIDSLSRPNGVTLSPDAKHLYVAVSDPSHAVWYRYDVVKPGEVANKKIYHDVTYLVGKPGQQGLPDGLKANRLGYVFATGPDGVWIFNPGGTPIARIHTGQLTSNCALTTDQKRLYMTADDYVLSVGLL